MQMNHQTTTQAQPQERRNAPRRDVRLSAKAGIRYGAPVTCVVLNISPMGALIEFSEAVTIPKHFRIAIDSVMFSADCELRHHTGRTAGVMFISNRMEALAAFG